MARSVSRGTNRLTRDNAGRITSVGGNGATARGGRLRTASGKQRGVQTARVKAGGGAGRVAKPKGMKPGALKSNPGGGEAKTSRPIRAKEQLDVRIARVKSKINSKAIAVKDELRKVDNAKNRDNSTSITPRWQKLMQREAKAERAARSVMRASKAVRRIELTATPEKFGYARGSEQRRKMAGEIRQARRALAATKKAAAAAEKAYRESPVVKYGLQSEIGGNRRQSRKARQRASTRQTSLVDNYVGLRINVRNQEQGIQGLRAKAKAQTAKTNQSRRSR